MTAHTPGPWLVSEFGSGEDEPLNIWRDDGRSDFYLRTEHVAMCVYDDEEGPSIVTAKANARLIAAAPDLLKLAEQYASECGECGGTGVHPCIVGKHTPQAGVGEEPCPDCADIRAVIAKATQP